LRLRSVAFAKDCLPVIGDSFEWASAAASLGEPRCERRLSVPPPALDNELFVSMSRPSDTTESERILGKVKPRTPGLRLLFSAEAVQPSTPWYPLVSGEHAIGREIGKARGLQLHGDRRASRVHAAVAAGGSATPIEISDANSKNGVFINGTRCQRAALRDGDVIRIGDSLMILRYEAAEVADAPIESLLGCSPAQRALRARVHAVAESEALVLLLGESGTGKDLTARAIHVESGRSGSFVAVNCGAVPDSLVESQFFGHVSGSFTGAGRDRAGYFAAADRGTLFLDEIGELSPRGQTLLLRVIEDRLVTPIGSTTPQLCDVRIIAATNRDLQKAIEQGGFRGDLYARLSALRLQLPPLRERREDILLLLTHALGMHSVSMTARLAEALLLYRFPFNIRELRQIAHELRASGEELLDLPLISERLATPPSPPARTKEDAQTDADPALIHKQPLSRDVLLRLLEEHRGIIARVAQAAGRSRRQVMRWLEQHQIDARRYRR